MKKKGNKKMPRLRQKIINNPILTSQSGRLLQTDRGYCVWDWLPSGEGRDWGRGEDTHQVDGSREH